MPLLMNILVISYGKYFKGPKVNCNSIIHAAKMNDYDRVKILFRYGYRQVIYFYISNIKINYIIID